MKKNLGLFALLVALLSVTWVFQEKRVEKEYTEARRRGKLVTGGITSLKLPALTAEKKGNQWWSGTQLLSHNTFKMIEAKLQNVTSIKDIEGRPETFFQNAISIEVNGEPWMIGQMSLDKEGFYVSKNGKIHVAIIDAESGQVAQEGESIEEKKLGELSGLLTKDFESLKETQLFRYYPKLPFEKVTVAADGNLAYELNLKENKTTPAPIPGIAAHEGLSEKFLSVITQIFLKEEVPYSEKLKGSSLASITFSGAGEKDLRWELWLQRKDSADVFLIDSLGKRAFRMIGGSLRPFFLNVQDYWDKKVIPPSQFKSFDRLPVKVYAGDKEFRLTVINREPLDFSVEGRKVRPGNMQDLFQLIFNLGPRDQASRVSQLTKSEKQQFLNGEALRFEIMGQDLLCVRYTSELLLVNLTQGFKAHFINPFENLHCKLEDVLE